jgi:ribosome maturation factor RimP
VSGLSRLEELLMPAVGAAGYRLVRLRLMGGKRKTLQAMAERNDGHMDVEDCAALSRLLSEVLEAADLISDDYVLEVSSPGIDRPLTRLEDFVRFVGHDAQIELVRPNEENRRRFRGTITAIEGSDILLKVSNAPDPLRIPYENVAEAKLILTDRLIAESLKAQEARQRELQAQGIASTG